MGIGKKWGWPPATHTTCSVPQLPSARRTCAGPRSSAVSPRTHASRPVSTVTRRATVLTAVTRLAAVSRELGWGRARGLGLVSGCPSPISASTLLPPGSSEPFPHSLYLCPSHPSPHSCLPVPPQVVTPPQELIQASRGQTVTFTCVASGVPTPIINWRLNWGHIPSHPRYGPGPRWGLRM